MSYLNEGYNNFLTRELPLPGREIYLDSSIEWAAVADTTNAPDANADVTSANTAAAIAGQGALATENAADFATQVNGAAKPANNATVGATLGTDLKDSGATVLTDQDVVNIKTMTAGETINGATLPVPVYQDTSDGEVYACDANVSTKLKFIGFGISNSTDGNPIKVQLTGRVAGFTGLTQGSNYFVQDAVGTIDTAKGTYVVLVGVAVSATEVRIVTENVEGMLIKFIASDTLRVSADTERINTTSSYVKQKDISINHYGSVRVKFDLRAQPNDITQVYGRIYINDVAVGTEQSQSSSTYATYSQDFSGIDPTDVIQLYTKGASGSADAYCRNFRIYWDKISVTDYTVNTD